MIYLSQNGEHDTDQSGSEECHVVSTPNIGLQDTPSLRHSHVQSLFSFCGPMLLIKLVEFAELLSQFMKSQTLLLYTSFTFPNNTERQIQKIQNGFARIPSKVQKVRRVIFLFFLPHRRSCLTFYMRFYQTRPCQTTSELA